MTEQRLQMTRGQLAEMIQANVKDFVGAELATIIRKNVEESVSPLRQQVTDWGARITERQSLRGRAEREPGIAMARCVRAVAAARMQGSGPTGAIEVLKGWGYHEEADEWVAARQKAMTAGDATAGGFLVPVQFVQDFIAVLRSATVMRRLRTPTIPMPMGTAKIGKGTAGATASYVGESVNAPKTQMSTGQLTLSFKKLMALVPVSNDLLRYSSPGADMIVRNDLVAAMSVKEDSAFIRGDGTDGSPRGLRYWAPGANVITANGTVSLQNTATDLGKLMQQLMDADIPMVNPVWIFSPRTRNFLMTLVTTAGSFIYKDEMATGTLWGYPFGMTTGVPSNLDFTGAATNDESEIYFADLGQGLIGEAESMAIDASQEAAYHDGSSVQSAWSRDETTVRAIAEHDFIMRYDKAVALLAGVDWAPGSV
mgnify:CR=1 FL=1